MGTKQGAKSPKKQQNKGTSILSGAIVILLIPAAVFAFGFLKGNTQIAGADLTQHYSSAFLSSEIGADSPEAPPGAAFPHIVYEEGELFVRGVAASQEDIDATITQLEELFGAGNVVAEVVLDPGFEADPLQTTEVYFTENVLFGSGSAVIAPRFLDVLAASAKFLQISPETSITITGHTDTNGSELSNLELSQARVDNAREAMIGAGGDPDRITAIGVGEADPISDNSTAEGRQANRRVELTIHPAEVESSP